MEPQSPRTIIVIPGATSALDPVLGKTSPAAPFSWVYFGKDVSCFLELEKKIGNLGNNIPISALLQDTAESCRQAFIDLVGSCAEDYSEPWWYLTSVSEKNPYASDLYLHFCYLKTFFTVVNQSQGTLVVICEKSALIRSIRKNAGHHPSLGTFEFTDPGTDFSASLQTLYTKLRSKSTFVLRFSTRILLAMVVKRLHGGLPEDARNPMVIHSWADKRSFQGNNTYTEIYFGSLVEKLASGPRAFFLFIDILPTVFYPLAVKKMFSVKTPWHLFEEYLSLSDLWAAFRVSSAIQKRQVPHKTLSDLDVTDLIRGEMDRDHQHARTELAYLYYAAGRRIAGSHHPASFWYTFENHVWEKMSLLGIRDVSPKTRMIGYAHSTVNSLELSYSLSRFEKDLIPLPDVILVNGPKPREVLMHSGFDEERIHIIGSLRYGTLGSVSRIKSRAPPCTILVILSADINRTLEMIERCGKAFGSCRDISVIFKPHPVQKTSRIESHVQQLPGHFRVSAVSLDRLLDEADVALYSDSTGSVEAVARGIPVVHMKSAFLIDINIFEKSPLFPSVSTPEELRTQATGLCSSGPGDREEYRNAIQALFWPVDDSALMREITKTES